MLKKWSVLLLAFVISFSSACTKSPENIAELISPIIYAMSKNLISQNKSSGGLDIKITYHSLKMSPKDEWPSGEIKCIVELSEYKGKKAGIQYILDGTHIATALVEMPGKARKQVKVNLYENAIVFGQARTVENKIAELSDTLMKKLNKTGQIAVFDFVGLNDEKLILGKRISESLVTNFSQKDYKIVERKLLESVLKEQSFQQTGLTGDSVRNEIGKFLGADAVLVGTIKVEKEELIINSRIIDLKTGTVISSGRIIFPKYLVSATDLRRYY